MGILERRVKRSNEDSKQLFNEYLFERSIRSCIKGSLIIIFSLVFSIYAGRNIYRFPMSIMYLKIGVILFFLTFVALELIVGHKKTKLVKLSFYAAIFAAVGFGMAFGIIVSIYSPEYTARATQVSMAVIMGCVLFADPIRERMGTVIMVNLMIFTALVFAVYGFSVIKFFEFYVMMVFTIVITVFNGIYTESLFKEFTLKRELNEKLEQLKEEIEEKELLQNKLVDLASYDSLTKLYNRRKGLDLLELHFSKADEAGLSLGVCYMDIDNLKEINDHYGHTAGDRYILDFIDAIRQNIRETDYCIRMGGDEFLLVFPKSDLEKVEMVWDRIVSCINGSDKKCEYQYKMSASHGVASYSEGRYNSHMEMIDEADRRMYIEKDSKRTA